MQFQRCNWSGKLENRVVHQGEIVNWLEALKNRASFLAPENHRNRANCFSKGSILNLICQCISSRFCWKEKDRIPFSFYRFLDKNSSDVDLFRSAFHFSWKLGDDFWNKILIDFRSSNTLRVVPTRKTWIAWKMSEM